MSNTYYKSTTSSLVFIHICSCFQRHARLHMRHRCTTVFGIPRRDHQHHHVNKHVVSQTTSRCRVNVQDWRFNDKRALGKMHGMAPQVSVHKLGPGPSRGSDPSPLKPSSPQSLSPRLPMSTRSHHTVCQSTCFATTCATFCSPSLWRVPVHPESSCMRPLLT